MITELNKDYMMTHISEQDVNFANTNSDEPIVIQALPKWDSAYASTSLTIAKHLSVDRPVFYIEHPYSFLDLFKKSAWESLKKRQTGKVESPFSTYPNLSVIHPPIILPINVLEESKVYNYFLSSYLKTLWKYIDKVLKTHQIESFIYINSFDPTLGEISTSLNCTKQIYHCVDWIGGEKYIAKHGVKKEQEFISTHAHLVVTTSEPLAKSLKKWNANTICIPNAADFNHFSGFHAEPIEYKSIPGKKLVYVGNIGLRIDYSLIEKTALAHPEWSFIFVGPKDPSYFRGQSLEKLENVHFLGARSYTVLPSYMQHADLALIPFEKNTLTNFIYPLKLNEYLATGVPVLSSNFTDLSDFESAISIYSTDDEFENKIEQSITTDTSEKETHRIFLTQHNTWENRISQWKKYLIN